MLIILIVICAIALTIGAAFLTLMAFTLIPDRISDKIPTAIYVTIIIIEFILLLSYGMIHVYPRELAYEAENERLSHITGYVIEIPNITTCEGMPITRYHKSHLTYSGVKCNDGTLYNNATYIIRDTLWDSSIENKLK